LPRERRWVLIRDVQRKYDDLCVKEPKEQLAEMDAASLKRKIDTKEKEVGKIEKRFKKYNEFLNVAAITEAEEIEEADDVEALRNQIRLRTHVYQMKVVTLIGDG
jgi:predicted translin family RNA/ssDNA-binding protein